ncbi:MAG: glycosyltransferase family 2 protein [Candidatus Aminicenantes bacterium]|nr:MAG: glycosyltransferase family 2 protein [Candidatus Aminicenantes bacterium]
MKLSVVIITLNEEDRLEDALKSCRGIADEIVVVDSYSTDRTVEIAQQYGAKIYKNTFIDYGSQKNFALDKAENQWVLNLDADERVSGILEKEIRKLKQKTGDEIDADGFLIKRKTFYLDRWIKHSGWYPDRKLRLFRKDKSQWCGRVHEGLRLEGKTVKMEGDILHFTYRNITDHINRLNRYSHMQASDIVEKKKKMLYLRAFLLPPVTFIRFYIWKLGILDGLPGLVIALVSSWATAMKYLKAIEIKRKNQKKS